MSSDKNFWLVTIQNHWLAVALVVYDQNKYQVKTIGPKVTNNWDNDDQLIAAIDTSLSAAANEVNLPPSEEPSKAAFILPPFWVGADGKIVDVRLRQIEAICKSLDFRPMGFISDDEAIVENANAKEGLPVSFVLINLSPKEIITSLVYLGKVKARITRSVPSIGFDPVLIQESLNHIDNQDNALPPQIMVFGDYTPAWVNSVRNYNWITNKSTSTFLHMPDIDAIDFGSLFEIFTEVIVSQIDVSAQVSNTVTTPNLNNYETVEVLNEPLSDAQDESSPDKSEDDTIEVSTLPLSDSLTEASASDFGFVSSVAPAAPATTVSNLPIIDKIPEDLNQFVSGLPDSNISPPKPQRSRAAIKIPSVKLNFAGVKLMPVIVILLLVLSVLIVPLFISTSSITLYLTPYQFSKSVAVTLDTQATDYNPSTLVIPVTKKNFDVSVTNSIATTGKKTTGDKAKGEVVIFNKQDKAVSVAKGAILTDSSNRKYELLTSVSVASSSSDLQTGIITMGQTRTMVQAAEIGDQYNIAKDLQLTFKDYTTTQLIARSTQAFSGGFSKDIAAVAENDKKTLESKLATDINSDIDAKLKEEVAVLSGALKDTIKTQKNRPEYNREVGEEASELSATQKASVSVLVVDPGIHRTLITSLLQDESGFADSEFDPANFNLSFKITKTEDSKALGEISITGHSTPRLDTQPLAKMLTLKTVSQARTILRKEVKRVYDYKIEQKMAGLLQVLPLNPNNINFELKSAN